MSIKAPFASDNSLDTPGIAKIKGARGDALIADYRRFHGDCTLLAFSRGKDSIATALALRGCHFVRQHESACRLLGLAPGYRFMLDGSYLDVWYDPTLLNV